jgi:hypothetical protein
VQHGIRRVNRLKREAKECLRRSVNRQPLSKRWPDIPVSIKYVQYSGTGGAPAEAAERRAAVAEELSDNVTPRPVRAKQMSSTAVYEYTGKICRVCGRPAPPASGKHRDSLRFARWWPAGRRRGGVIM